MGDLVMKKSKTEKLERATFRERVADNLEASKEIILDVPKIIFVGSREVVVENYKAISEYTQCKIVLESKPCGLRFSGKELEIKSITREMLLITGKIQKMEFGGGEGKDSAN